MKKIVVSILLLTVVNAGVNAQTLKEKIAAKKAALEVKLNSKLSGGYVPTVLDPNISQPEILIKWEDKEYSKYTKGSREPQSKGVDVKIIKSGGEITGVSLNGVDYFPDEKGKSTFVRYYKSDKNKNWKVVFTEAKIIVFTGESKNATGKYFLNGPGDHVDIGVLETYLESSKVNQKAELDLYAEKQKANADKAFAEKEAIWSIKGKKVTKIEVTDITAAHSKGYYRSFSFQVKATLANGKTISTKDGGFWSDYTITYANADVKNKTIQDTRFVKDDKVIIQVKSKFDSKVVATADLVMDYSETLTMNFNSNNWGVSGSDLKIEMKQRKHAVTGKEVVMIKVTDLTGYAKPKYMIIDANQSLNVWTKGHNGYKTVGKGNDTGPGANAGNGGNVTVYKDPSVKSFNIDYTSNGGIGGAGTYGYNRGRDGRDGKYKEVVRAVNF